MTGVVILGVREEATESVDGQSLVYGLGGAGSFISEGEGGQWSLPMRQKARVLTLSAA